MPAPVLKPKANNTTSGLVVSSGSHNSTHGRMTAGVQKPRISISWARLHVRSAPKFVHRSENLHVPRARSAAKYPSFDVFADALLPQSKPAAPVAHECAPRQAAPWYRRPSRRGCRPCSSLNGPGRLVRARRDQRDQLAVMLDRIAEIGRLQAEIGERRARRGLIYARRAGCRRAVRTSGARELV